MTAPAASSIAPEGGRGRSRRLIRPVDVAPTLTPAPTLLAASILTLATGLLYAGVGVRYARRARTRPALAWFALFWFGVAYYGVTEALWSLAVPLADPPLALGVAVLHTKLAVGAAGFLGLAAYVLHVYTGRAHLRWLAPAYAAIYAYAAYSYVAARPVGQEAQAWRSGLVYANDGGLAGVLANVALFLPPLVASIAYAGLYRRVVDPAQRRRVLAVSLSLAAFFGGLLVGWTLHAAWWPPVERALALGTVLLAHAALRDD